MPSRRSVLRRAVLVVAAVSVAQLMSGSASPAVPCTAYASKDNEKWRCSEDSEGIRHALHIGLRIQKAWDHWIGPVDLDRQDLRLSGFENYAIISAVMLQILVGFYAGVAHPKDHSGEATPAAAAAPASAVASAAKPEAAPTAPSKDVVDKLVFEIQMFLLLIAVLCSTFTMVMFLLAKICNVTALGLYKDVNYATFLHSSRSHRVLAFWSLFIALGTFLLAFALDLFRRVAGPRGVAVKVIAIVGGLYMLWEWADIMWLADKHIFTNGRPRMS